MRVLFYFKGGDNMSKIKKKQYVFYTNWNKHELKCACLFHNPCCYQVPKECEEIELEYSPYEDLEEYEEQKRK